MPRKPKRPQLQKGHPLAQGLVGAWLVYEGAGATARDVSGRGNHGALQDDVAWTTGRDGVALDFPGADGSNVNVGNPEILQLSGAMTIALRMQIDGAPPSFSAAVSKLTLTRGYEVTVRSGRDLRCFIATDASTLESVISNEVLSLGVSYSIAFVFRPDEALEVYVNGELDNTAATAANSQYSESNNFTIGQRANEDGSGFDGHIPYVYMYSRPLPASQIRALHADPYAPFRPVRRWWAAVDVSGLTHPVIGSSVVNSRAIIGGPS